MFPVRYELDSYILFRRNSVVKVLITSLVFEIRSPLHSNGVSVHIKPVIYTIIFIFQHFYHSPETTYQISQVIGTESLCII
jgi:hypothetical protein